MRPNQFHKFITHHASTISLQQLRDLGSRIPELQTRIAQIDQSKFPDAVAEFDLIAKAVALTAHGKDTRVPLVSAAECGFALLYLQRDTDVIPDFLGDAGLIDDAVIVSTVFERNAAPLLVLAARHAEA